MNAFPLRLTPGLPILGHDPEVIADSWRRLLDAGAKRVYPAHGPPLCETEESFSPGSC